MPCSFCRSSHHTIRSCNSEDINLIYGEMLQRLSTRLSDILNDYRATGEANIICRTKFERVLNHFTLIQLKAVCIRKYESPSSMVKICYITKIINNCPLFYYNLIVRERIFGIEIPPYNISHFIPSNTNINISNEQKINIIKINIIVEPASNTEKENQDCAICLESETYSNLVQLNCAHTFCSSCIVSSFANHHSDSRPTCALCRGQIHSLTVRNSKINNVFINKTYNYIKIVS